ncbi:PAS fold protein [Caballeronia calidae]|uniref:PAS fold protein n=1 Tax=Caballeronia calidae TaxID=1777139 RepID=A0A158EE61_9BURK|nr:PAS domain-containing protein [Caballeronia calidae]SAL05179.1 PAS fold protein [Caballeronia calidae]
MQLRTSDAIDVHEKLTSELAKNAPVAALVDQRGILVEATSAFESMFPSRVGTPISGCFNLDFPGRYSTGQAGIYSAHGVFERPTGERIPVMLQMLTSIRDREAFTAVIVTDASAYRSAEEARFDATPCSVLRVSLTGLVAFANKVVSKEFPHHRGKLIGAPIESLFDPAHAHRISAAISRCKRWRKAVKLEVASAPIGNRSGRAVSIVFTPEFAPGKIIIGLVVVIEDAAQTIRGRIRRLALAPEVATVSPRNPECPYWHVQLAAIFAEIRKLIHFDHANFGFYADDGKMFRAVCMYPEDTKQSLSWPSRYLALPEFVPEFLRSGKTWIPNVQTFVAQDPRLLESDVVRRYHDFGIRSALTLPVFDGLGHPQCALSLCSKEENRYGRRQLRVLKDLDLEHILQRCEQSDRRDRERFAAEMREIIDREGPLRDAAKKVINRIRKQFEWDYVALFRVNRQKEVFELFYQDSSENRFRMPNDYEQPIGKGMLASSLREDKTRIVNEIGAKTVEQYGYYGRRRGLRSAMTVPIHLGKIGNKPRVRWVLDAECATASAFCGPDIEAIKAVVECLERSLHTRMLEEMNDCLMREADRGVVLVGSDGIIMCRNATASHLLNVDDTFIGDLGYLSDYAEGDRSKKILNGDVRTTKRRVTLASNYPVENTSEHDEKLNISLKGIADSGPKVSVLATRVDLDQSFDAALWFLTDIQGIEWNRDIRFLHETVSAVAQQTRAPLTLASLIARNIPAIVSDCMGSLVSQREGVAKIGSLVTRVVSEMTKADITFERLAEAVSIRESPKRMDKPVNIRDCVREVWEGFPDYDRESIKLALSSSDVYLNGDDGRLRFVLRSIIAHLMRLQCDDSARVCVRLKTVGRNANLLIALSQPKRHGAMPDSDGPDDLLQAMLEAREAASLSLTEIQLIVNRHGGEIKTRSSGIQEADGASIPTCFALRFPQV